MRNKLRTIKEMAYERIFVKYCYPLVLIKLFFELFQSLVVRNVIIIIIEPSTFKKDM